MKIINNSSPGFDKVKISIHSKHNIKGFKDNAASIMLQHPIVRKTLQLKRVVTGAAAGTQR